ncbi:MAG: oligosaccharide flippase family protein [Nonlabens sp.]
MSSIKRLFQHTFIYGLATVLPRLLTILLTYLLTKYLPSPVEFGEANIIFSYIIFANVVLTYGMETAFFRFYNQREHKAKTTSTALVSLLFSTLFFLIVCYILLDPIAGLIDISADYIKWAIAVVAFDTLAVVPFAKMRVDQQPGKYALIKMFNVILTVGMTILFFTTLPDLPAIAAVLPSDRIELYFIALLSASVLTFLLICGVYFRTWSFDQKLWKKMLSYGWPILLAGLAFAVNETVDKILLQKFLPLSDTDAKAVVGVYSAGYRLAVGMTLFAQAFRLGVEPFFFSQAKEKNSLQQYALITKAFVALGVIALMAYVVLVDFIRPFMVDEGFEVAMEIIPVVLIAYLFSGIYQTLSVWYKINDKTIYGAVISGIAAVVTIAINVVLIPRYGYLASAGATCAAYGLMMMVSYLVGKKHFPVPYELGKISLYLILGIVFSCLFYYYLRPENGIESLTTYLYGAGLVVLLTATIVFLEKDLLQGITRKNKV